MAATVVSVVIFTCGVLVGRGVRAERGDAVAEASTEAPLETVPAPAPASTTGAVTPGSDPTGAAPPPPADDLSYFSRLEKTNPPKETLKPEANRADAAPAKPAPAPAPSKSADADKTGDEAKASAKAEKAAPPPPAPKERAAKPAAPAAAEAAGAYAVQVAALNARSEADAIAKRLSSKGYAAYVVPPGNGAVMYRVRVGHFKTRRDAEPVFTKLQKEEQFKPWITR
jgi:cell division septation protein DedD